MVLLSTAMEAPGTLRHGLPLNHEGLHACPPRREPELPDRLKNMVAPWTDMSFHEEEVVEAAGALTVRLRVEATHTGEFLGVAPAGRRVT